MADRRLIVTADDFGLGPETSRGVLDLGSLGVVTSTVLLVNSPHAESSVAAWTAAARPVEMGWHPCLTMDAPVSSPAAVPSLVDAAGRFLSLGGLLKRLMLGRVMTDEVEAEFRAQYRRFVELVGAPPTNVNGHHHVHIFRTVGDALLKVLADQRPRPFVRRVVEPWATLRAVRGVRVKRWALSRFGRHAARRQAAAGFPGNDALAGVTDPPFVQDPEFFVRWVKTTPGEVVELMCHPGYADEAIGGRDGSPTAGHADRRVQELKLLTAPTFRNAVAEAGFELAPAAE
jgi:predicted glycoside hydrolase/deacetylase ChbG (UPF0249 family)